MNRRWLAAAAAVGLLTIVLPVTLPGSRVWQVTLENTAHAAVFALVALALANRFKAGTVFGITAVLAALTELLQIPGPRTAALSDFWLDLAGAGVALGVLYARGTARLRARLLLVISTVVTLTPVVTTALAYRDRTANLPYIAHFEAPWSTVLLSGTARLDRALLPMRWRSISDAHTLHIQFPVADYPRVNLLEPVTDWQNYRSLVLDIVNAETFEVPLTVMLRDDRPEGASGVFDHAQTLRLTPAVRGRFTLDLSRLAVRNATFPLDLTRIQRVTLYIDHPARSASLYLVSLRLE